MHPELLWATWTNHGVESCAPMAVLLDPTYRQVVITVRGTADMTDCVTDICLHTTFFDPFGMAQEGDSRKEPFDAETGLFVIETWLNKAKSAEERVRPILETALRVGGKAHGWHILVTGHSLGASIACLLGLILRTTYKEKVRYVGFEPAGPTLCKRLSLETQRLGWLSVVCGHDFAPRVSGKNVQRILNLALGELEACDRSKMQLTLLLFSGAIKQMRPLQCLRRPLAAPFRCLAGGSLGKTYSWSKHDALPLLELPRFSESLPEMWPAGDVIYFRPLAHEWYCCCGEKDVEWAAKWADPADVQQELVLSLRAMELHAPWVYEHGIQCVAKRFREHHAEPLPHTSRVAGGAMRRQCLDPVLQRLADPL